MAYYKIINGIRYDRNLLEVAENFTKGRGEWQISLEEIQEIFQTAYDGNTITPTEQRTLAYIGQHFPLTAPAKNWFEARITGMNGSETPDDIIRRTIREELGFLHLNWQFDPVETNRTFSGPHAAEELADTVKRAMNAFIYNGRNVLSLQPLVRRRTGNGRIEDQDFILKTVGEYLERSGLLFLVPEGAEARQELSYDLPKDLDFNNFRYIGLFIPELSPVFFMASVSRRIPGFQFSQGYISRLTPLEDLIRSVKVQLTGFTRLRSEIDPEEVTRQMEMYPEQNFGEALFGALFVGIFNGESSFSFRDFIGQEVWQDPDLERSDYMRAYIETGLLRLLSPQGNPGFPIPGNLTPDYEYDWVFGLQMPTKTDIRFIITSSRDFGFDASWNDGFIPENLSLEAQIQTVLNEFGLPDLQVILPDGEFENQRSLFGPDYRTFSSLLRQALNTMLNDYLHPKSAFNFVAAKYADDVNPDHHDDPQEYRAAIRHLINHYLQNEGNSLEFLPMERPENNPVDGEPIEDFWQFFGLIPALSTTGFWVLIPRYPDDGQLPYCYGLNQEE